MPLSYATMEKQMSSIPLTMVEPMPGEGVKQIQQKKGVQFWINCYYLIKQNG